MKTIKWIMPLVVASVVVISGCSQMTQQSAGSSATSAASANRLTTGNAVGSGLSRSGRSTLSNRLGVSRSGSTLGSGASSRFGGTTGSTSRLGSATTAGIGGSRTGLGGRTTSSFGGATTGAFGNGRGGSLSSRGFGSNGASGSLSGGSGSGSLDNRIGANGADNRLGGSGSGSLAGRGGASGSGVGGAGGDYKVTDLNDSSSILSRRVIYFAYDQSTIEPEYFEILDAHSELLASNPNLTIRLEGHADERGSREYNVALSERRAKAVKQFMDIKGVGPKQSQTVAYGEELPVDTGHNEAAWSKNRRVEIKYIGR